MNLKVSPVSYNKAIAIRNNNDCTKTPETSFKSKPVAANVHQNMSLIGFGTLLILAIGSILYYGSKEAITILKIVLLSVNLILFHFIK